MKKISSSTLTTRVYNISDNSYDSATSEINYPEKTHQPLNTTFVNTIDGEPVAQPFGYSEGKVSSVEEEEDVTMAGPKEASIKMFEGLAASGNWSSIATYNLNLSSKEILKYSSNNSFGLYKDLRFTPIDKKYDLFYFDFSNLKKSDLEYCIANSLSSSRPSAVGFIAGIDNSNLDQLRQLGFSKSSSLSSDSVFFIKKNDLNKIASVKIYDANKNEKSFFLCDIANSLEDKIAGLQPYKSLKYGSGLIFPYDKPQDVTYHMGSVSFPIDIIFVGAEGKIKKIAENIAPGTLGVFGSSGVSLVLEISGGASSSLGIRVGDFVSAGKISDSEYLEFDKKYASFISENKFYIKNASFTKIVSFDQYSIFNSDVKNQSSLNIIKNASIKNIDKKQISIYNFDDYFKNNFGEIDGMSLKSFLNNKNFNLTKINKISSLSNFLSSNSFTPPEIRDAFYQIKSDLNSGKKVVIATELNNNLNVLKSLIIKRASEEVIFDSKIHSLEIISIPNSNIETTLDGLFERYSSSVLYKKILLEKYAGSPISDEIKEQASKALDLLLDTKKKLSVIVDAFKNNSEQYLKNKEKTDFIKKTKKDYNLSCKRISKKVVDMLLEIKESIKLMNKIKDLSTVDEKIESLSLSCKEFVETSEKIFELEVKITEDGFPDLLSTETNRIEKSAEDIENNINNFSDYISKNILNKRILSR